MDEVFGCRLTVKTARTEFDGSEAILVQAELKNISQEPQEIAMRLGPEVWYFHVTDQLGDSVPLTRYGRALRGEVPSHARRGSNTATTLQPGLSIRETIVLNHICDLSMHGTYSVTVAMNIGRGVDFVRLKAPPLTLKIGSPGFTLSADVQRLALTGEARDKKATILAMAPKLQDTIDAVKESGRSDETGIVRAAARTLLARIAGAAAEGIAQGRPETPASGSGGPSD